MKSIRFEAFIFTEVKTNDLIVKAVKRYSITEDEYCLDGLTIRPGTRRAFIVLAALFSGELKI